MRQSAIWLGAAALLAASPAAAEITVQTMDVECGPIDELLQHVAVAGQKGLLLADSNREEGAKTLLLVNQDDGTYSLILVLPDMTACTLDAGSGFEPYIEEPGQGG